MSKLVEPTPLREEIKPYKNTITYALAASTALIGILSMKSEVILLFNQFELYKLLYIILFTLIILMGLSWVQSGLHELEITAYWLRTTHYKPPQDITIISTIFVIGIVISILASCTRHIIVFGLIFLLYLTIDLYWWKIRKNNYRIAIYSAQKHAKENNKKYHDREITILKGIDEMEIFYIKRPHYKKLFISIGFAVIAIAISISDSIIGEKMAKVVPYIIFIIQIIVGEIIIQFWRIERDRKLQKLKEELEYGINIDL